MIILQLLSALLTVLNAWIQKPFVLARKQKGSTQRQTFYFHAISFGSRAVVCAGLSLLAPDFLPAFFLTGLVSYLVFDPALNLFIGWKWYYLGTTANTDNVVKNGKIKAIVILLSIIGLNFFL